jgi:hypothetical protein
LEEAANKGDWGTVKSILDRINIDDPYKMSMERHFRPRVVEYLKGITRMTRGGIPTIF